MNEYKGLFIFVAFLLVIVIGSAIARYLKVEAERPTADTVAVRVDTITIHDTIRITSPSPSHTRVLDTIFIPLPRTTSPISADTSHIDTDSATVPIPIEQNYYRDTLYEAWVSGYRASLDSLRIYAPTQTITIERTVDRVQYRSKRWGIGVQVGYGITPHGMQPFIGIGVSYRLWSF